jgi:sulfite reductase (NADPH) hemoprotein beta-component
MYKYDSFDHAFVNERVAQFKDQVERRLAGRLSEDEFRPLRLMNGLYLQLHAYMLRIAIPYGVLSPTQLRQLGHIGRTFDRGYGHFTTRQNIQFNWVKLVDAPDILQALADVEMHAIQTSGNCVRNVTADPFAGAAHDELEDPRPWAEVLRQWSTLHPEFSFLPRKFKIAITGAAEDRAAILFHDIGIRLVKNADGEVGFRIYVGGGMGRTPYVGLEIRNFLPKRHLLSYIESILRVYNLHGRRDNIYKARIKILVNALGIDEFRRQVEADWDATRKDVVDLPEAERRRIFAYFAPPELEPRTPISAAETSRRNTDPAFGNWARNNVRPHKVAGFASVVIALKEPGRTPGDAASDEMDAVAALAERFGHDEIRVTYSQNLVLPHVARDDLPAIFDGLVAAGLATGNNELIGDIICCPGLDYCNLANARSIPLAKEIAKRFASPERQAEIGPLRLNMSGCINACGHHHAGNIGILGVDKKGTELYQITLGGSPKDDAAVGQIVGPGFTAEKTPQAIETIVDTYIAQREEGESFVDTCRRIGVKPFKEALYGAH